MFPTIYEIKKGVNKKGNSYKFLQFKIKTPSGVYTSGPIFPTPLEMSILDNSSDHKEPENNQPSGITEIYSDASLNAEF